MNVRAVVSKAPWRPRYGERFNFYSHLSALLLSLAGAYRMLAHDAWQLGWAGVSGVSVYLCALVGVFAASSALHFFHAFPTERGTLQRLDHCAIYALVAGTYTPFATMAPPGNGWWPWAVLLALWGCAAAGARREWRSTASAGSSVTLYAGMGWTAVAGAVPLAAQRSTPACAWLIAGALLYSVGIFFYRNRRGYAHAHGVWHLTVLAGAAAHYVGIGFVLRAGTVASP